MNRFASTYHHSPTPTPTPLSQLSSNLILPLLVLFYNHFPTSSGIQFSYFQSSPFLQPISSFPSPACPSPTSAQSPHFALLLHPLILLPKSALSTFILFSILTHISSFSFHTLTYSSLFLMLNLLLLSLMLFPCYSFFYGKF